MAGEQFCSKAPRSSAGKQAEHGSVVHLSSEEGQEPPGLHLQCTAGRQREIILPRNTCEPLLGLLC